MLQELSPDVTKLIYGASPAISFTSTYFLSKKYEPQISIPAGIGIGYSCAYPIMNEAGIRALAWWFVACTAASISSYAVHFALEKDL